MEEIDARIWSNYLDGDNYLKIDCLNLDENSIVFDVGGYKGDWSEKLFRKYNCTIYIFEPVKEYYQVLVDRFKNCPDRIKIFNIGLSNETKELYISNLGDSSSCLIPGDETISLVSMKDFFKDNYFKDNIDLIKINIEGEEYNLFDDIIYNKLINKFDRYLVQFHDISNTSQSQKNFILNWLKDGFSPVYSFDFLWEYWEKTNVIDLKKITAIHQNMLQKLIIELKKIDVDYTSIKNEYIKLQDSLNAHINTTNKDMAILNSNISKLTHEKNRELAILNQEHSNILNEINRDTAIKNQANNDLIHDKNIKINTLADELKIIKNRSLIETIRYYFIYNSIKNK